LNDTEGVSCIVGFRDGRSKSIEGTVYSFLGIADVELMMEEIEDEISF